MLLCFIDLKGSVASHSLFTCQLTCAAQCYKQNSILVFPLLHTVGARTSDFLNTGAELLLFSVEPLRNGLLRGQKKLAVVEGFNPFTTRMFDGVL